MIKTGTKVIVLTSPLEGKAGPRKGSIGYVTQLAEPGQNVFYNKDNDVFVHLTKVTFTRYGFEINKQRRETRFFLNIFPSFLMPLKFKNPAKSLDINIARVKNIETFGTPFWDGLRNRASVLYGRGDVHEGTLVPLPFTEASLLKVSKEEFESWLGSIVTSHVFYNMLYLMAMAHADHLGQTLDFDLINQVRKMHSDRRYRNSALPRLSGDEASRSIIVSFIRKTMSIAYRSGYKRDLYKTEKQIEALFSREVTRTIMATASEMLMKDLYSDAEFISKGKLLVKLVKGARSAKVVLMLAYLSKMRNRLRCLAQALEEGMDDKKETLKATQKQGEV